MNTVANRYVLVSPTPFNLYFLSKLPFLEQFVLPDSFQKFEVGLLISAPWPWGVRGLSLPYQSVSIIFLGQRYKDNPSHINTNSSLRFFKWGWWENVLSLLIVQLIKEPISEGFLICNRGKSKGKAGGCKKIQMQSKKLSERDR